MTPRFPPTSPTMKGSAMISEHGIHGVESVSISRRSHGMPIPFHVIEIDARDKDGNLTTIILYSAEPLKIEVTE